MKNTFTLLTFKKWNRHLVRMTVIIVSLILISMSGFTQITAPNVSRCGEGVVTLTATTELTGGMLTWYDVPFYGGKITSGVSSDGTTFITPVLQESTTYYIDYVIDGVGVCDRKPIKVTINNTTVTANIYYSSVTYCNSLNEPQTVTNSGSTNGMYSVTPSSPLVVNASSGTFNPFGVTPGDYTITYTIPAEQQPAGCSEAPINTTITIVAALTTPVIASFTSPLCNAGAAPFNLSLSSGPSGGTYSASPNGLNITTAGLVTPVGSSPGNYTITYTKAGTGGCIPQHANASLTITGLPTASILYSGSPFCKDIANATPTLMGTGAYSNGAYSYTGSGLTSFSTSTGAFDPSASTAGAYTIKYTAPASAGCAAVEVTTPVTINSLPTASLEGATSVCQGAAAPNITFTGLTGIAPFTFTYKINGGTDKFVATSSANSVTVSQATVSAGTYIYALNSVSDGNGCSQTLSGTPTQTITVTGSPVASFEYPSSLYCTTGAATPSYINGGVAGAFTSSPNGLSIASGTGVIDVAASASGIYTVTNTVSACGNPVVANVAVTINHVNPTISGGDDATCGSTILTANSDATNATYIWYKNNVAIEGETTSTLEVTETADYTVQVTNTDTGCAETSASKTVTINPLPVCSISGLTEVTYGTTNVYTAPADMETYAWSISGDGTIVGAANERTVSIKTLAAVTYTLSVTINSGTCTSTCEQTVYVDKVELTVKADAKSKSYNGSVFSLFTSTITGYVNGETIAVVTGTPTYTGAATTAVDFGTYTITPVVSGLSATNYTFAAANGSLDITKVELTVTADAKSKSYNGSVFSPFTSNITGYVNGETIAVVTGTPTYTGAATTAVDFGTYTITPVVSGLSATNYTFAAANGSLDITKVELTVKADAKSKSYNGSVFSLFTSTITGYVNGETIAVVAGTPTYTGAATTAVDFGTYTITPVVSGLSATNYTFAAANGSLDITKVELTVTADAKSKSYNGSVFSPFTSNITGYVNGETIAVVTGTPTYTGAATTAVDFGTYTITPVVSGLSATNYTFTAANGSLQITKATITELAITGITAPVIYAIPVTTATNTVQYTASVTWSPAHDPFIIETVYTATIAITPTANYTLTGVAENSFTVARATVTNAADAGVVTAVFPKTLVIGDAYQGGKVFYILQSGDTGYDPNVTHGLIATTTDLGTSAWSNVTIDLVGTATAIGTGLANTVAIIGQSGHTASAAQLCTDYLVGGYSWYLPSDDELHKMIMNNNAAGLGISTEGLHYYWSSSQSIYDSTYAHFRCLYNGNIEQFDPKTSLNYVRAIHSF